MQRRIFRRAAQTVEHDPAPPIFCQAQIVITTLFFGAVVTLRTEVFDLLPRSESPQLFKFDLCQRTDVSAPFDLIEAEFGLPFANADDDAVEILFRTRPPQGIYRFRTGCASYFLAHRPFPLPLDLKIRPISLRSNVAKYVSLVAAPRQNQSARLGAVLDLKIALRGLRQRAIRRIEQLARKSYRQFVAQVTSAGEQRELGFGVSSSQRFSMIALVVQDRCGDARRVSALFGQTVKLISGALPY